MPPFSSQEEARQLGPHEQPTEELPALEFVPEASAVAGALGLPLSDDQEAAK